jgi:magnesium chelatase accessory protein
MMARWDLNPLVADLRGLTAPLTLVAAQNDRAVPPWVSRKIAALAPNSSLAELPSLGHLAHEEAPGRIAEIIRGAVKTGGRGAGSQPAAAGRAPALTHP